MWPRPTWSSTCGSSSAGGSALPRPAEPTRKACAASPRTPRPSVGWSRSSRTGAAFPAPPRRSRSRPGTARRPPRRAPSFAPTRSGRSSTPPTQLASWPTAHSRPGASRSPWRIPRGPELGARGRPRSSSPSRWVPAAEPATQNPRPWTPRRSMRQLLAARRLARREPRPMPSPSSPATIRSCSRSTRSSICSTCSATSGSQPWPSRRSAASSSPANGSAASS